MYSLALRVFGQLRPATQVKQRRQEENRRDFHPEANAQDAPVGSLTSPAARLASLEVLVSCTAPQWQSKARPTRSGQASSSFSHRVRTSMTPPQRS